MQVEESIKSWRSALERRGMKVRQRETIHERGTKVEVRKARKEEDLST